MKTRKSRNNYATLNFPSVYTHYHKNGRLGVFKAHMGHYSVQRQFSSPNLAQCTWGMPNFNSDVQLP